MIIRTFEQYNNNLDDLSYISNRIVDGYVSGNEPFYWKIVYKLMGNYTMDEVDYKQVASEILKGVDEGEIMSVNPDETNQTIGSWKFYTK